MLRTHCVKSEWADYAVHTQCEVGVGRLCCAHTVWKSEWADYTVQTQCGSQSGWTILSRHSVETHEGNEPRHQLIKEHSSTVNFCFKNAVLQY